MEKAKNFVIWLFRTVTEGSVLNQTLTYVFLSLSAFCFFALAKDPKAFGYFLCFILFCIFILTTCYNKIRSLGLYINNHYFTSGQNKDVFSNKRQLHKWTETVCWFILHSTATLLELPTILTTPWLKHPETTFMPCPIDKDMPPPDRRVVIAFMFELAAYIYTGFAHRFLDVRKKDYYVMFVHHITTVALIIGSYTTMNYKVGLIIMFLHDSSDVMVDITQIFNHARMQGPEWHYIADTCFIGLLSSWFYTRLVILPFRVIRVILFESHDRCAGKEGPFWVNPTCSGIPFWQPAVVFLCILVCMHAWWFYLFLKILFKNITFGTSKGTVDEAYESELKSVDSKKVE